MGHRGKEKDDEVTVSQDGSPLRRFVVLEHSPDECSDMAIHWDLMLDTNPDELLATWSFAPQKLPLGPVSIPAERLPDHRRIYLDYEGPIGGGRGTVRRIDSGTFQVLEKNRFRLFGQWFCGTLSVLVSPSESGEFLLLFFPEKP